LIAIKSLKYTKFFYHKVVLNNSELMKIMDISEIVYGRYLENIVRFL